MKVLITGANGFIGKNLQIHLRSKKIEYVACTRENSDKLEDLLSGVDFIFHLAGVNRPQNEHEFKTGNADFTTRLCSLLNKLQKKVPILYTSSAQAVLDNAYGKSKLEAENILKTYSQENNIPFYNYRLPGVFGKWARPNYNSVVATFCNNIVRGLPIQVNDTEAIVRLVYVDDVISEFLKALSGEVVQTNPQVEPVYEVTLGALAEKLNAFKKSNHTLITGRVGVGFDRALYSTYLSYFETAGFSYPLVKHSDPRGEFVEMLKTPDCGQFSYFTAHPGITRGGHYHHSKNEKFLVLKGHALFKFRHILTDEYYEMETHGGEPVVVETIPGWTHDITNIGTDEMIVMLWANEIFEPEKPDTYAEKVVKEI